MAKVIHDDKRGRSGIAEALGQRVHSNGLLRNKKIGPFLAKPKLFLDSQKA
jgi:hypothetical protein